MLKIHSETLSKFGNTLRENKKDIAYVGIALAALMTGAVLLGIGAQGLHVEQFHHSFHGLNLRPTYVASVMRTPEAIAQSVKLATAGSLILGAGGYLLGRYGFDKAKRKFPRLNELKQRITEGKNWKPMQIALASAALVGGVIALTVAAHFLTTHAQAPNNFPPGWSLKNGKVLYICKTPQLNSYLAAHHLATGFLIGGGVAVGAGALAAAEGAYAHYKTKAGKASAKKMFEQL